MKGIHLFIRSAGAILLMAALNRFLIALGTHPVLLIPEPLLGIPLRYAVLLVGGLEVFVAFICLFGRQASLQLGWVAWLATSNAVYCVGLFLMHWHPQATCIGSLTDPLQLSPGVLGVVTGLAPFFLLLGGYAGIGWLWLSDRRRQAARFVKMFCPSCGTHIRFAVENLGQQISCPRCKSDIALSRPGNLKMSCFFCHGHIEFPAHAAGEKMPCPHCHKDITLKLSSATSA